jgi:DNA polymerase III subunit epsilon
VVISDGCRIAGFIAAHDFAVSRAVWHRHVRPGEYVDERAWYQATVGKAPTIVPLPATDRYRGELIWQPVEPEGGRPSWLK